MKNKKLFIGIIVILLLNIFIVIAEDKTEYPKVDGNKIEFTATTKISWTGSVEIPKTIEDRNTVIVRGGGKITQDFNGDMREYGNVDGKFIFDKNGKLIEAEFKTLGEGNYKLGNKEIRIPGNSQVIYKDGKVRIRYEGELKPEKPKALTTNGINENTIIEYETRGIILDNGEKFMGIMKFKEGFYFDSKEVKIGSINLKNTEGIATYLFFDGKAHPEVVEAAYLSYIPGRVTLGCNADIKGPAVSFDANNPYGIKIENGDSFSMRALGNSEGCYISIINRDGENKVPYVETLNQWVMDQDGKSTYYNTQTNAQYIRIDGTLIPEFQTIGSGSTPLEIHRFKTDGGKIVSASKYGNVFGIGNKVNFGMGPNPRFIRTHPGSYTGKRRSELPGLYSGFSNSLTYNYDHTLEGLRKFTGIKIVDSIGKTKDPRNVEMLMDIFASIPADDIKKWGAYQMNIVGYGWWAGLATSWDKNFYVNNAGFTPHTIRHELTHMHDFVSGKGFNNDWDSIGGSKGPHTYSYGYTGGEDTSTFAEMIYNGDDWKKWLGSDYKFNAKFRARVAVMTKWGFISREEASRAYTIGGLGGDVSDARLEQYIAAGRDAYKRLG